MRTYVLPPWEGPKMNAKITYRLIRSLTPKEKPYEVTDAELAGFTLRVQPTGNMVYYAAYRLPDRRRNRIRLGSAAVLSPTEARRKARQVLTEVAKGNDPAQSRRRPRGPTLRSFLENDYGPWVTVNRKGGQLTLDRIHSTFSDLLEKKLVDNPSI
jgi:hypothetical protein